MKSQKPAKPVTKAAEKREVAAEFLADKFTGVRNKTIEEPIEPGPTPYIILRNDDIENLLVSVNIMIKLGYEPIGGAAFSTKLGFWYQSLLLPPERREVKRG